MWLQDIIYQMNKAMDKIIQTPITLFWKDNYIQSPSRDMSCDIRGYTMNGNISR
jgi:hypothetical protein